MGCYVISVSAGKGCYRHIQISKEASLYMLHKAIINAFDFDDDHGHVFFMDNHYWSKGEPYFSDKIEPGAITTKHCKLNTLGLEKGRQFKYLFDLGAEWRFQCKVLRENDDHVDIPFVVRSVGEAPEQYPDVEAWDEESDEISLEQKVEELYQQLNLPEKLVHNVRSYFIAAGRLYGAIPVFDLFDIYNNQNIPISAEEFVALAMLFDVENHHFRIIGPENFLEDAEFDPEQWFVVADYLLEDEAEDFFELVEGQKGKTYKRLPKSEFLKYVDEDYFPLTPQSLAMQKYLHRHKELRWPDDTWLGIQTMIEMDYSAEEILDVISSQGFMAKNYEDMQKFLKLLQNLNNHTRKHINCGHTPEELFDPNHVRLTIGGKKRSNKPATPSLNGHCPCGSGKKYKRCCGKNKK